MNAAVKGLVAIAMLSLAGCAMAARPALDVANARRERAVPNVETCEKEIYYLSSADDQSALRCATLLDIWR